jgi:DNA-binding transcriptional regulator PaaX
MAEATNDATRVDTITRNLENYFAAIGAPKGHVFELRDINLQVMMNAFAADERALLDVALSRLVDDGSLQRVSATGCSLTDEGLARVKRARSGPAAITRP